MNKVETKAMLQNHFRNAYKNGYIIGGSKGPMTCTNAHLECNEERKKEAYDLMRENNCPPFTLLEEIRPTHKASEGYDPSYKTYWFKIFWTRQKRRTILFSL